MSEWQELSGVAEDAYQRGREDERRDVVAWLRAEGHREWYTAADALERREHEEQASKPSECERCWGKGYHLYECGEYCGLGGCGGPHEQGCPDCDGTGNKEQG